MEFYVIINDEQQGPFTIDQLATLDITPETEVWAQGMPDWMPAGEVAALTQLLQQLEYKRHMAASTPPAPAPVQPATVVPETYGTGSSPYTTQAYEPEQRPYAPQPQPAPRRRGGCLLWSSLVVIILLAVMVVTVPSRQDHINTIKDVTREWMSATIEEKGMGGSIFGEVTKWIGGTGADMVIDQMFTYDNYFVCSVGNFNYGNRTKRVSLGIFGHVFTFDKDDINEALKNAFKTDEPEQEPSVGIDPPVEEIIPDEVPLPDEEVTPDEEQDDNSDPFKAIKDTIKSRAKKEVKKVAKDLVEKGIDELIPDPK